MKNHLSMELSILAGGSSWWAGRGGSCSTLTRWGECATVTLVLHLSVRMNWTKGGSIRGDTTGVSLASDEAVPSLSALTDDVHGVATIC